MKEQKTPQNYLKSLLANLAIDRQSNQWTDYLNQKLTD